MTVLKYENGKLLLPQITAPIIINISPPHYEHNNVRVGDMLAFCNLTDHLRKVNKNIIKIHFENSVINNKPHCYKFRDFLLKETDYLSPEKGNYTLPLFDTWLYRFSIGGTDHVKIRNKAITQKKICVFPVFDAQYNTFRNWPIADTQKLIDFYSSSEFSEYRKFFCSIIAPDLNYRGFELSSDFETNLKHIMECEYFIGGDTGTSHFAGALDPSPPNLIYFLSDSRSENLSLETFVKNGRQMPFHFRTKGKIVNYSHK